MNRYLIRLAGFWMIALSLLYFSTGCTKGNSKDMTNLPGLPRPIAEEPALITSAGQSTDTYIIKDIANQLMIHNFFMPQAKETDIKDIKTIVFVIGYSPIGEELHNIHFEDEKNRIEKLLEKAKKDKLTVITILPGGKQRRGEKADELLGLIGKETDYLIGTREGNEADDMFVKIAQKEDIPLTLVKEVNDISEPFASAFR